jgi:secreted trypsin-like serine protease
MKQAYCYCSLILFLIHSAYAGTRTLNGVPVDIEQAPYMVHLKIQIGSKYTGFCGGTIVSRSYILSAGHCM